ncbi:hypothetical protein EYC80_003138 [Monilinia laxa]|uniref:Uncharacterized protein n=1 Tax=Monilinia laxa TaxID=61186 RepID=A0A5N6KCW5_MONLA|nr:hypothetical protein EYC80_003138 [Monilinia laxa]
MIESKMDQRSSHRSLTIVHVIRMRGGGLGSAIAGLVKIWARSRMIEDLISLSSRWRMDWSLSFYTVSPGCSV